MTHADPWDENARLEKQMHLELLGQVEDPLPDVLTRRPSRSRSFGGRAAFISLRPRDADVERQ
ncbi:MAG: hypothetical protein OEO79_11035 [Gemmatimonadota bacterium]|nr:hypothetical protein [Gemmatimonadota bacterium]